MVPALKKAGLPTAVRFYDFRHTCASLMIAQGAHPKLIMERLGHKDITTTMNVYGHLFPALEEKMVEGLDELGRRVRNAPAATSSSDVHELPLAADA